MTGPANPTAKAADPRHSTIILVSIFAVLCINVALSAQFVDAFAIRNYVYSALAHGAIYCLAVWFVVCRQSGGPRDLAVILAGAVVLRFIAMSAEPNLSTDAYRYIWDGRIGLGGINPYLFVPADPVLASFRDAEIFPNILKKEIAHTIYPPVAQTIFMAGAAISESITGMRAVMAVFEALTIAALIGWLRCDNLPASRVIIYAWHPLPIWEFASQAHIDAAATALIAIGIWAAVTKRQGLLGFAFGLAALVKYFPVVLLPALWRRWDWRMPAALVATIVVFYLPYIREAGLGVLGFLGKHLDSEGYRAGWGFHPVWLLRDFSIADPPSSAYIAVAMVILFALAAWAFFFRGRDEIKPEAIALIGAAFVFFTSPHYPWYFGFLVALLVRVPHPALFAMTIFAIVLQYPRPPGGATWTELYALAYWLPLFIWLGMLGWQRLKRDRAGGSSG